MNGAGDKKPSEKASEISAYCAFKDDRDRRLALLSRDVRLVVIAAIVVVGAYFVPMPGVRAMFALLGLPV